MPATLQIRNRAFFKEKTKFEILKLPGFSLIELMVVISLFAITTIAVTTSYISFQGREILKNGALQLKTDLRQAQNSAQTGDIVDATSCSRSDLTYHLAGWYVTLDSTFANNTSYTLSGDCYVDTTGVDTSIGPKTKTLPNDVTITSIKYAGVVTSGPVTILFSPLQYKVNFYDTLVNESAPGSGKDFIDNTTKLLKVGLSGFPDELVARVHSSDGDYDIHIKGSGEINEEKI